MRTGASMTIEDLTDAIERMHVTTFDIWEATGSDATWDYVQEALDDVTARLIIRYADQREREAAEPPVRAAS